MGSAPKGAIVGSHRSCDPTTEDPFDLVSNGVDFMETRSGSRVGFRRIARPAETLGEFRYLKSTPFPGVPRRREQESIRSEDNSSELPKPARREHLHQAGLAQRII